MNTVTNGNATGDSKIEQIIQDIRIAGTNWANAECDWEQLKDLTKELRENKLADLKTNIALQNKTKLSESELERKARTTIVYQDYVKEIYKARAEARKNQIKCRALYEAAKARYELARSHMSLKRSKINQGIFHEGN